MTYLFIFAHPDDETVASAITIKRLIDQGEKVVLITVTDGGAGEVSPQVRTAIGDHLSVAEIRRQEMQRVSTHLGIRHSEILDFNDGEITNSMVWGKLKHTLIDRLDFYRPDFVITFDHTGWYFHLDHVAVSIAVTLAVQQVSHPPEALLLSHFRVNQGKWKYIFTDSLPITHYVEMRNEKEMKMKALELHASQNLSTSLLDDPHHQELYQVVFSTTKGSQLLENHPVFKKMVPSSKGK